MEPSMKIKYHQPGYTSPFTPHELAVFDDSCEIVLATHTHVLNDPQKRGWCLNEDIDELEPPCYGPYLRDELFNTPEEAVAWRRANP
jgi:hypothetical protein